MPTGKKKVSFIDELWFSEATRSDWAYFSRWHYRTKSLGFLKYATLLWHQEKAIGICIFISPALSLKQRSHFFGLSGKRTRFKTKALNHQLVTLSRVVIHPSYRGAGIASEFIRKSCYSSRWPWIEALAQMGQYNPFFERAGFIRVGKSKKNNESRNSHTGIYSGRNPSGKKLMISKQTHRKSQFSDPIYYVFKNSKER